MHVHYSEFPLHIEQRKHEPLMALIITCSHHIFLIQAAKHSRMYTEVKSGSSRDMHKMTFPKYILRECITYENNTLWHVAMAMTSPNE